MEDIITSILNMDKPQLDKVMECVKERRNQLSAIKKLALSVGDEVWIDHRSHGVLEVFIVESINPKTVSVKSKEGLQGYRVAPSLLNKFKNV